MICTITPIVNRQQVASYYSRDDYYSKDARKEDYCRGTLLNFSVLMAYLLTKSILKNLSISPVSVIISVMENLQRLPVTLLFSPQVCVTFTSYITRIS